MIVHYAQPHQTSPHLVCAYVVSTLYYSSNPMSSYLSLSLSIVVWYHGSMIRIYFAMIRIYFAMKRSRVYIHNTIKFN